MIEDKEFEAKKRALWGGVVLLFFLTLFSASKSWAVGNIHWGLITIHPGFGVKQTYYHLIDEDRPSLGGDHSTTYSPGIRIAWPVRQHTIKCDWLLDFRRYHEHKNQDYTGRRLSTNGDFVFGQGGRQITLGLGHVKIVSDESDDIGETRQKRNENKLSSKLGVNFNDNLRLDLSYNLDTYNYQDYDLDDRDESRLGTSINVRIQPKTEAFISGQYNQSNYKDTENDSGSWSMGPGLRWDATAKLSGQISAGFSWKDYEKRESINTWVVRVDLTHRASEFTRLSLGIDKGERDHSVPKKRADGKIIEDLNNLSFHQVRISLNHQLTYKVNALSGFTYEYDNYHGVSRKDSLYAFRIGLKYQIQDWLVTDIGFEQRHRNCTGDDYLEPDYLNRIYSLSLGLAL